MRNSVVQHNPQAEETVIVSGLPRSGTSLVMAMVAAGGFPLLEDASRPADRHNPGGYHEYAPVRNSRKDVSWVDNAAGRAVKVIATWLPWLPADRRYRVLFVLRHPLEVAVSQRRMVEGGPAAILESDRLAARLLAKHLREVAGWLRTAGHMDVCWLSYRSILRNPRNQAVRMAAFLGLRLELDRMAEVVRAGWWRCRASHIKEIFPESCNKEFFLDTIPSTDLATRPAGAGTRDVPVPVADFTGGNAHGGLHHNKARLP